LFPTEWLRMTRDIKGRSKKDLAGLARRKRISGWQDMTKDQLIKALSASSNHHAKPKPKSKLKKVLKIKARKVKTRKIKVHKKTKVIVRSRPQMVAARNSSNGTHSAEEQVERSKYDVGVPTKDLSAKVPRD